MNTKTTTKRPILSLGRQSLSIILSYLEETEGTSLLLCRKLWTRSLLPIFRLVDDEGDENNSNVSLVGTMKAANGKDSNGTDDSHDCHQHPPRRNGSRLRIKQYRHHFIAIPVPDPTTRLARLNTRRYRRKLRSMSKMMIMTTKTMTTTTMGDPNNNKIGKGDVAGHDLFQNMSTEQIARNEWTRTVTHLDGHDTRDPNDPTTDDGIGSCDALPLTPPLLQFYRPNLCHCPNNGKLPLFLHGTTLLASYPRSGNTMVRRLLESVTGFVTGSDTRPDRPLSMALADQPFDLVGEGVVSSAVTPLCKTHWPERVGCQPYDTHRIILLVRNPFDAIDSYWHLNVTNTHTDKVTDDVYRQYSDFYKSLVRNEMKVWMDFLNYYNDDGNTNSRGANGTSSVSTLPPGSNNGRHGIPVLWVRYEDVVRDPGHELKRMLTFCTPDDWWKTRLEMLVMREGGQADPPLQQSTSTKVDMKVPSQTQRCRHHPSSPLPAAKSKSPSSSIGRSLQKQRFDPHLLQELHAMDESGDGWLERLGYHIYHQGFPNNLDSLPPLPNSDSVEPTANHGARSRINDNDNKVTSKVTTRGHQSVTINRPLSHELRARDSPFGRNMRDWRRERTFDDTKPFPTV